MLSCAACGDSLTPSREHAGNFYTLPVRRQRHAPQQISRQPLKRCGTDRTGLDRQPDFRPRRHHARAISKHDITVILLLFALMLLPTASEKVELNSIRWISVLVFWFVVICALLWMFLAVIYRMNVKGGLKVSIIVFVSGLMVGFPVSCCPNIRETLTIGNIYSYRFFFGCYPAPLRLAF